MKHEPARGRNEAFSDVDERELFLRNAARVDCAILRGYVNVRSKCGQEQDHKNEEVRQGTNVCGFNLPNRCKSTRPVAKSTRNLRPPLRVKVKRVQFTVATEILYKLDDPPVIKLGCSLTRPISLEDLVLESSARNIRCKELEAKHTEELVEILLEQGWLDPCIKYHTRSMLVSLFRLKQAVEDEAWILFAGKSTINSKPTPLPLMNLDRCASEGFPFGKRFLTTNQYLSGLDDDELISAVLDEKCTVPDYPTVTALCHMPKELLQPQLPQHNGVSLDDLTLYQLRKECLHQGVDKAMLHCEMTGWDYAKLFTVLDCKQLHD
jgi:hypothetical protein